MNRSLVKKCMVESRWLLLASAAVMFAFCWVRVWLVSLFEMSRFETIVEQFREFEHLSPVPFDQLFTYAGRIALTYDEPIVIVCMSLWAIARGSDCISGEIGRGTMEMLLAQPLSRASILWSHAAVTIVGVGLLAAASWLGIYVGVMTTSVAEPAPRPSLTLPWLDVELPNPLAAPETVRTPMQEKVDPAVFAPASFNLFALGLFLAGFSTLLSSLDRYRWRTIGVVAGVYVVQVIVKIVGVAAEDWSWLTYGSFFTAYEPEHLVHVVVDSSELAWSIFRRDESGRLVDLGPLGYSLVLIVMGAAAYAAATAAFRRRDIPAPL